MAKKKVIQERLEEDREQTRLNKLLVLQRQNDIVSMLLEGKDKKDIRTYIVNKYRVQASSSNVYITEAVNLIKERSNYEVNNLISLHVQRYEEIYAGLYEINAYGMAIQALKAKEKLLGFHKEGFHMRVNQGTLSSIQLQSVNSEYDVMKLSREQRDRMALLLNVAKEKRKKEIHGKEEDS